MGGGVLYFKIYILPQQTFIMMLKRKSYVNAQGYLPFGKVS